jgi:hypothetical protein
MLSELIKLIDVFLMLLMKPMRVKGVYRVSPWWLLGERMYPYLSEPLVPNVLMSMMKLPNS